MDVYVASTHATPRPSTRLRRRREISRPTHLPQTSRTLDTVEHGMGHGWPNVRERRAKVTRIPYMGCMETLNP